MSVFGNEMMGWSVIAVSLAERSCQQRLAHYCGRIIFRGGMMLYAHTHFSASSLHELFS